MSDLLECLGSLLVVELQLCDYATMLMSCMGVLNAVRTPFDRVKFLLACSEVKSLEAELA